MDETQEKITISTAEAKQIREEAEKNIKREELLNRLENNKDFKDLFLDVYCKDECERLVHLLAAPQLMASDKAEYYKNDIQQQMHAISYFVLWMQRVHMMAKAGRSELDSLREATIQG